MQVTIQSPVTNSLVVGREVKRFEHGLTVEDASGVIHYVSYSRVVGGAEGVSTAPVQKPVVEKASRRGSPPAAQATVSGNVSPVRTSKYVPRHGVCPKTGRALTKSGQVRAVRGSKKS